MTELDIPKGMEPARSAPPACATRPKPEIKQRLRVFVAVVGRHSRTHTLKSIAPALILRGSQSLIRSARSATFTRATSTTSPLTAKKAGKPGARDSCAC